MPKAISYQRFSAIHQGKGSTLDRQQQLIDQWVDQHPDVERSNLSVTDKGKSAYKGDHLNHGLGLILAAIKSGEIKAGDYILVEAIDRIGRLQPTDMVELINGIVKAGVTIVTLEDKTEYTKASLNDGMGALFILVGKVQQAHEYSKNLSRRISGAYEKKRRDARHGKPIKLTSPFWLTSEGKLIPEKAEIVRACIDMYLKGAGTRRILIDLVDQYPVLDSIHPTTVVRWLRNRSLIGEWTNGGDHIPDVFERLIDDPTFYRIQTELKSRTKGMSPEKTYDLTGLVKCSNCGGNYHFRRKNHSDYVITYANCSTYLKRGKGHCDNSKTWPYEVLMVIFNQSYYEHLSRFVLEEEKASGFVELEAKKGRLGEVNERINKLIELLLDMPDQNNIKDRLSLLNDEKVEVEGQILIFETELSSNVSLSDDDLEFIVAGDQYQVLDDDPVYRRGVLARVGYSIEGYMDKVVVDGLGDYTLVKRSTKHKCYFVEKYSPECQELDAFTGELEDVPSWTTKMAINRDGVINAAIVDTWEELFV